MVAPVLSGEVLPDEVLSGEVRSGEVLSVFAGSILNVDSSLKFSRKSVS
jgi:hypothetical protein